MLPTEMMWRKCTPFKIPCAISSCGYLLMFVAFGVWLFVGRSTKLRWIGPVICGLALGAASADLVENSRIGALAALMTDAAAQNVQIASRIKWAALAVTLLGVAISSAGIARSAFKQRKFGRNRLCR